MTRPDFYAAALAVILLCSCRGKQAGEESPFPERFNSLGDTGKVEYILKNATPDSVARFIIRASLGEVGGVSLDSLGTVTNYVYSTLSSDEQVVFGEEYEKEVSRLPLAKRMKLYALGASDDPQGLGYELGLNYLSEIRDRNMSADDVAAEIREFRNACGSDSDTYRRFVAGFKTVLRVDSGKDVSKEIYDRFAEMESL